jgi:hypothetical protein
MELEKREREEKTELGSSFLRPEFHWAHPDSSLGSRYDFIQTFYKSLRVQ